MIWKILSGLSAVALAAGLWFSYQNQGKLKEEQAQKKRAEDNLKQVQQVQQEAAAVLKVKKEKEFTELTQQRDSAKAEMAKANASIEEKQKEVETLKTALGESQKQLSLLNDEIRKAGDVKKLTAEVESLAKQVKDSEAGIANQEQQLALAQEKLGKVIAEIAHVKEVDARQKRGQIDPEFNARIAQPFPEYGFVVLSKGNLGGAVANAMLDVKRGKSIIAKLKVRDVEQGMAVADMVPGSLAQGESLRSGDLVVAAPLPQPPPDAAPASTPAPAAPGATPDGSAPAAPGGAPAAPAMGNADPFGAPAAPAPAPAGGAPAPAPAGADPFAPPAGGGAMAPAAGGDGTPQKPSTADPFAK